MALDDFIGRATNSVLEMGTNMADGLDVTIKNVMYGFDRNVLKQTGGGLVGNVWVQSTGYGIDATRIGLTSTMRISSPSSATNSSLAYSIPFLPGVNYQELTFEVPATYSTGSNFSSETCITPIADWIAFDYPIGPTTGIVTGGVWIPDKQSRLKDKIRRQLAEDNRKNHRGRTIRVNRNGSDFSSAQDNELTALRLLRKMLSTDEFRKYLKYGFISVRGDSGLIYNIKRNSHMIEVYRKGELVSSLCVYVHDKSIPPTDDVITKMVIVQCDEHNIWQRANISWIGVPQSLRVVTRKTFNKDTLLQLVA